MRIETETTPNPRTLKFLAGRPVSPGRPRDYVQAVDDGSSPLAHDLLALAGVERVMLGDDFVSVTRAEDGPEWAELRLAVLEVLAAHLATGGPLVLDDPEDTEVSDDPADREIVAEIRNILDERVRPAVAGDGGDIAYRGFRDGVVYLELHGSCAGCPSSTATLKGGIEQLLRYYVPEVVEVRAV